MSDTLPAGYGMISVRTVHAYRPTSHPRGAYSAVYNLGNPPRWWWFIIPVPYCYSTNYDTNNISHITTTKYLRRIVHTFPKARHTNNQKKRQPKKSHHGLRPRHNPSLPLPAAGDLRRRAHNWSQDPTAPNLPLPLCSGPLHQARARVFTGPASKKTNDGLP